MFTLADLCSGKVHSTVDDAADANSPFRLIYNESEDYSDDQSLWHFISYPVKYRPINFSSVAKARECIKAAVLNGFWNTETLPAQNYRFVELVNHVWQLVPIGCDKVPTDDIEVSECNSNLVWLVYYRVVDSRSLDIVEEDYRQWVYFNQSQPARSFAHKLLCAIEDRIAVDRLTDKHIAEVYVCGMSQDMADAILSNDIPVDWDKSCKL